MADYRWTPSLGSAYGQPVTRAQFVRKLIQGVQDASEPYGFKRMDERRVMRPGDQVTVTKRDEAGQEVVVARGYLKEIRFDSDLLRYHASGLGREVNFLSSPDMELAIAVAETYRYTNEYRNRQPMPDGQTDEKERQMESEFTATYVLDPATGVVKIYVQDATGDYPEPRTGDEDYNRVERQLGREPAIFATMPIEIFQAVKSCQKR